MDAFELDDLRRRHQAADEPYLEFLRVPALSAGLYVLPAGAADPQEPHAEDELYYVVAGRATIQVGQEERPVQAGSSVFVAAGVPHRFHGITEELAVLVVFAPAETAR